MVPAPPTNLRTIGFAAFALVLYNYLVSLYKSLTGLANPVAQASWSAVDSVTNEGAQTIPPGSGAATASAGSAGSPLAYIATSPGHLSKLYWSFVGNVANVGQTASFSLSVNGTPVPGPWPTSPANSASPTTGVTTIPNGGVSYNAGDQIQAIFTVGVAPLTQVCTGIMASAG